MRVLHRDEIQEAIDLGWAITAIPRCCRNCQNMGSPGYSCKIREEYIGPDSTVCDLWVGVRGAEIYPHPVDIKNIS